MPVPRDQSAGGRQSLHVPSNTWYHLVWTVRPMRNISLIEMMTIVVLASAVCLFARVATDV